MARVVKQGSCEDWLHCETNHPIHVKGDVSGSEIVLVGGGPRRAYLWFCDKGGNIGIASGAVALRKLAKAILAEVGE